MANSGAWRLAALLLAIPWAALADERSTGPVGIDSAALGLTGAGIAIGMVDQLRPGLPGFDNADHSHEHVRPRGVFVRDAAATANSDAGGRATQIAGILMGNATALHGVAPGVDLYASAYLSLGTNPGYQHALLATQHVGQQAGGAVRAVSHSWGKGLRTNAALDGQSLLTLGVDWLATQQDVLQVFAGNEGSGGAPLPTDNYNGLDVAFSEPVEGQYNRLHAGNLFLEDALGPRRSIDLVAPGADITTPKFGGGTLVETSAGFAPPHVVGTVALLQQYAEARIAQAAPRWDAAARRHEVMKAVLLNSADKVADEGDGLRLGMTKTIVDTQGLDWLESDASSDPAIPLDDQLGAGQLNAQRAKMQFESGQWNAGEAGVPRIGWDWSELSGAGDVNKVVLDDAIARGNFVSLTLAWDRQVKLDDGDADGLYDVGESFQELGLTNLDLHLLPRGATDLTQAVASSISLVDNVEHIFFPVPTSGQYEIWVRQVDAPLAGQDYALAWWTGAGQAAAGLPGDANQDGRVDLSDFGLLKLNFGRTGAQLADGDFDQNGRIDLSDFGLLKANFGRRGTIAVPEPSALVLLLLGGVVPWMHRRRGTLRSRITAR
jgi:hypothetical protein